MNRRVGAIAHASHSGPVGNERTVDFSEIASFLRCYRMTILTPIALMLGIAITYLYFATPSFTARAQLIMDPRIPEQIRSQTRDSVLSLDTAQVESGIAVLRSERIAAMAAVALNLRTAAELGTQPSLFARMVKLIRGTPAPLSEENAASRESRLLAESIAAGLDVRRSGLSYAIDVSFTSPNPVLAANLANAVADAYIRDQLDARSQAARAGADWLERRMAELRVQMNAAAKAVQQFKAKHDYRIFVAPESSAPPSGLDNVAPATGAPKPANSRTTLEELETAAQTYRRIYESFLEGFTESVQRQSFPVSETRILTPATPPLSKSEPKTTLVLALSTLVGSLVGFGGALVRHHLDRTVRSRRQMRDETGVECLGSIPAVQESTLSLRRIFAGRRGSRRHALRQASEAMQEADTPARSLTPEMRSSFQSIKTLLELRTREESVHCIGVTSVRHGEERRELAANIAALYAASGQRTLIMYTDTHTETQRATSEPANATAFRQLMQGTVKLERAIVPTTGARADVLVVADMDLSASLSDVSDASSMTLLLLDLLQSYDVIIVDLPPVLPVGNGLSLSTFLDGVILTAEYGVTSLDQLAEAAHWLDSAQVRIIGSVIVQTPN